MDQLLLQLSIILLAASENIPFFENYGVTNIMTPVKPDKLEALLQQSEYDPEETRFLVTGFRQGFKLEYDGPLDRQDASNNLPFTVGDEENSGVK